jgi:hypothetical protein
LRLDAEGLAQEAYEHGWDGVARNTERAAEALKAVEESSHAVGEAARNVASLLQDLSEPAALGDVADLLRSAILKLDALLEHLDSAATRVQEAAYAASAAGMDRLIAGTEAVGQHLAEASRNAILLRERVEREATLAKPVPVIRPTMTRDSAGAEARHCLPIVSKITRSRNGFVEPGSHCRCGVLRSARPAESRSMNTGRLSAVSAMSQVTILG